MKRKLRLDDLSVESFETIRTKPAARGTVHARESEVSAEPTCPLACDPGFTGTCPPNWTEVYTSPCCD